MGTFRLEVYLVGQWTVMGYDTFAGDWYVVEKGLASEEEAQAAAHRQPEKLERDQPGEQSGGQKGIQDQVISLDRTGNTGDSCDIG